MELSNFSKIFNPESGTLQLMADLGEALNGDQEYLMLGGGNPSHIPEVQAVLQKELQRIAGDADAFARMVGDYDSPQGNLGFRQALAELLQEQLGWPITKEHIALTNGSQASFGLLFNAFAGDYGNGQSKKILLPLTPEYIGYGDVGLQGKPLFKALLPLIEEQEDSLFYKYRVDFEHLELGDDIGAVCVSRPTNPTGNVITDNELQKLSRRTKAAGIPLIIDNAYGLPFPQIVYNDATPHWDEHVVLCMSLSKLGLPGVRTGIVIAQPQITELIERSNAVLNLAPGRFGPTLVRDLITNGEVMRLSRDVIKPFYHKKVLHAVARIEALMTDIPVRVHQPEGAIFLWLWFKGLPITSAELYQRLKQRGVLVIAGEGFFPGINNPEWQHQYECIRINYTAPEQDLEAALVIITDELRAVYSAALVS